MTRYLLIAALLPAAALLFYVRKQDKIEAEPGGMIMKLCGFGALTIISAVILETLGGAVLGAVFPEDSLIYIALDNFLIIAGAEEGGKLFALKKGTWKSPAVMRALTSIPGHTIFGIFMGFYYGVAKKEEMRRNESGMRFHLVSALIVPMLLHGFYDFCLSVSSLFFILIFFVFLIIVLIVSLLLVRSLAQKDEPVVQIFNPPTNPPMQ